MTQATVYVCIHTRTHTYTHNICAYLFIASHCIPHLQSHSVKLNGHVKEMCHHGQHIWILYTSGYITVFDMDSHKIIQNTELQELPNDPVTTLVVDCATGLIATAYTNGLIAYLWDGSDVGASISYFCSSNTVSFQKFSLTTVESCSDLDGHCQMWCGYNIGVIQIVRPPVEPSGETEVLKVLRMEDYYAELSCDVNVIQLKYSSQQQIMYALHDKELISCWNVGVNPKLCKVINLPYNTCSTAGKIYYNRLTNSFVYNFCC